MAQITLILQIDADYLLLYRTLEISTPADKFVPDANQRLSAKSA
jgi:hypothetical protein